MLEKTATGLAFVAVVALAPAAALASSAYKDLKQSFLGKGAISNATTSLGSFLTKSSDPLSFDFVSPSYDGLIPPGVGNYVYFNGFRQSYNSPVTYSFKRSVFNDFTLKAPLVLTGPVESVPFYLKLYIPDTLADPITVNTVDGLKTYAPLVLIDTSAASTYAFKITPVGNGTIRYTGTFSLADPDGGGLKDFFTISGALTQTKVNGIWQTANSNTLVLNRQMDSGPVLEKYFSRDALTDIGALPEPRDYLLISLGALGVGAALRRRRALPVAA